MFAVFDTANHKKETSGPGDTENQGHESSSKGPRKVEECRQREGLAFDVI